MNYLKIMNLSKNYGKFKALDKVNLEIPSGRIIGLLGKNGAGKSTLMRSVLGFLKHDGSVQILGKEVTRDNMMINNDIAFIPDVSSLDDRLTVRQTLNYVSGLNDKWNEVTARKLMAQSELPLDKKVGRLSKGMKTKLYLLITLSLDVKILLLDEPTLGLDIVFRKEFFNTILGEFFAEDKTIIISTHQVEEVEHILQDIIFIEKGKIILYEDIEKLKDQYRVVNVPISRKDEIMNFKPLLVTRTLGTISAILPSEVEIPEAEYQRASLSDLFLAKVGGSNE